jgi:hypothetical protein
MSFEYCAFHADEPVAGVALGDDIGTEAFTCDRGSGHPDGQQRTWASNPEPPSTVGIGGLAQELSLDFELPKAVGSYGRWVEYGLVERAYALSRPDDFAVLVGRFGHSEQKDHLNYTASAYLARTLGALSRSGDVAFRPGSGTGRWSYNATISYWAIPPAPDWAEHLTWAGSGKTVDCINR